jgi:hypothetical protein
LLKSESAEYATATAMITHFGSLCGYLATFKRALVIVVLLGERRRVREGGSGL